MKQLFLAKKIDITNATISHIENNKTDVCISRLHDIAFPMEVKYLFSYPLEFLLPLNK